MNGKILQTLLQQQFITEQQYSFLECIYSKKKFSLYYELRAMLSVGVLLFSTGVGILIYLNIDTIGHQIIILVLSIIMSVCFWYAFNIKPQYSHSEVASPNISYEYVLFLGCLLFAAILGYVQYQYELFGDRWELSALIPALMFFPCAYIFDHRGVLSLAITGLASWLGLSVSPVAMLKLGVIPGHDLIISGLVLGAALIIAAVIFDYRGIKRHFTFTYFLFGSQLLFVSCLAALFTLHEAWLYFPLLMALTIAGVFYARREQSFLFVLMSAVYGYIGATYIIGSEIIVGGFTIWLWYLIISGGFVVYGLFNYKKFFAKKS